MLSPYLLPELDRRLASVGHGTGPYSTAVGRQAEYGLWRSLGPAAAEWLIQRLDTTHDMATVWGMSNILSAMAPASVAPIVSALEQELSVERADALLSALSAMDPEQLLPQQRRLERLLSRYLDHDDDAVRSKAAVATRSLNDEVALVLLRHALAKEQDDDVRDTLGYAIQERTRK